MQLRSTASYEVKKLFTKPDHYQVSGIVSGLQIIAYMGTKINKKCESRFLTIESKFVNREALKTPAGLMAELAELERLMDDLQQQGQPVTSLKLYSALQRALSVLLTMPELTVPLALPVEDCRKKNPMNGDALLEILKEVDFDLRNDPKYKPLMVKPVAPPIAPVSAGGHRPFRMLPKFHSAQKADTTCINERDLGKCEIPDCKALHQVKEFTHKECENEIYKKHGVCPNFAHRDGKPFCLDKHKKSGYKETKAKLEQAKREYPAAFAGAEGTTAKEPAGGAASEEQGVLEMFVQGEVDASNTLPEGTVRNRRAPERLVDEYTPQLVEHPEELEELSVANSMTDPEVTDSEPSEQHGEMTNNSFISNGAESNQSEEWKPDAEEESSGDEISPEFAHLLQAS